MNALEKKVFSYIEEHQMLLPGERVVAGISGGADSVCLLFVLLEWKKMYGLEPAVVHINHGIRPEAGEDARFVQDLCEKHGIPFYLREVNIPELAKELGCSEEEAGRRFRYEAFEEVAHELGATKIAVAHNANDLSETMLFHLFRGTGMKGLTGIPPVRDQIIRPLLCAERGEIERYLAELSQDYCHDATNDEDDYTRNRIRHHILAYAEEEIVPGCVQHMARTAAILSETENYLEQETRKALAECICGQQTEEIVVQGTYRDQTYIVELACEKFSELHPAIGKRVILEAINQVTPHVRDISSVHVDDIYELLLRRGNRRISLPHNMEAAREYDKLVLRRGLGKPSEDDPLKRISVDFQVIPVEDLPRNQENSLIFPQNRYTKWFDYDKIEKPPVVRTRQLGDYLTIRDKEGRLCHKKLKVYMVTEKIPKSERDTCPLLAVDSHVIWLIDYRISEYYKVCENTKQVLQVQLNLEDYKTEEENG